MCRIVPSISAQLSQELPLETHLITQLSCIQQKLTAIYRVFDEYSTNTPLLKNLCSLKLKEQRNRHDQERSADSHSGEQRSLTER